MAARSKRILVVEDSDAVARALVLLLVHEGHTVVATSSGVAALARAASFAPDVAVIHVGLRDVRGEEVARRLRSAASPPRLVGITGAALSSLSKEQREPFDALLHKPFSLGELLSLL